MKYAVAITVVSLNLLFSVSCKKKKETVEEVQQTQTVTTGTPTPTSTPRTFSGTAQKGAYQENSEIIVKDLTSNLSQTGISFSSEILSGAYQFNNVELSGTTVLLSVNGYYYNEVCGAPSVSQLQLNCIANITGTTPVNINVLTHLERPRVEYLVDNGLSLDSAKHTAQREIYAIFSASTNVPVNAERLDILGQSDNDAALLAFSGILQGFRSEAEVASLLSAIATDIKTDGILNSTSLGSSLLDHARNLDTIQIRSNIINYYSNIGQNIIPARFEKYILNFLSNTTYSPAYSVQDFPVNGAGGANILVRNQTTFTAQPLSIAGTIKKCSKLRIKVTRLSGAVFGYANASNLTVSLYDNVTHSQHYTVINSGVPFDLHFSTFQYAAGTYKVEYFETDYLVPTFTKTITIN